MARTVKSLNPVGTSRASKALAAACQAVLFAWRNNCMPFASCAGCPPLRVLLSVEGRWPAPAIQHQQASSAGPAVPASLRDNRGHRADNQVTVMSSAPAYPNCRLHCPSNAPIICCTTWMSWQRPLSHTSMNAAATTVPSTQLTLQSLGMLNVKEHLLEEDGGKLAIQRRLECEIDAEAEPAAGRSWPGCKLPPAFAHPQPSCLRYTFLLHAAPRPRSAGRVGHATMTWRAHV